MFQVDTVVRYCCSGESNSVSDDHPHMVRAFTNFLKRSAWSIL